MMPTKTLDRSLLAVAMGALLTACGEPRSSAPNSEEEAPTNVLLFVVDTLRADRIETGLTPTIDAFAAQSLVFESAYSQATQTHPAMASILTGLAPPRHGVLSQAQTLREKVVPLAELLSDEGYLTGSFVANLCNLQTVENTVWADGWDEQFCGQVFGTEQYLWDEDVVDAALEWMDGVDEPFFAWLHLMDPHSEYRPSPMDWDYEARPVRPAHEQGRLYSDFLQRYETPPEEVRTELYELYDAQVRGVDRQFARVRAFLEEQQLTERTLMIFVSDHGDELFETWPKAGHGFSMTEGVLRVPLIIGGPGIGPGRVADPVESLQVTPTVLDALGLEAPYAFDGDSLLGESPSRGWAASYVADHATVRREQSRWWSQLDQLKSVKSMDRYLLKYPSHLQAPWYTAPENYAEYEPGSNQPQFQDLDDPDRRRAVAMAFRKPLVQFLTTRETASGNEILEPALEAALEQLGYR